MDRAKDSPCSVMVFTRDEEVNLPGCLASLIWCDDVIVVDSFSTDRTCAIAKEYGARLFQHRFEGFGSQRNWALAETAPKHEWVLILDADERVPRGMVEELSRVLPGGPGNVAAYRVARRFHLWARWLRYSSLYPSYVVRLVRRGHVTYVNRGHAETQAVEGETSQLRTALIDENLKGIDEWFERQNRYSRREAEYEIEQESQAWHFRDVFSQDPLTRRAALKRFGSALPGRPIWYFLYSYVLRGGFLDGRDGLVFCLMRSMFVAMVNIKKYDLRRSRK